MPAGLLEGDHVNDPEIDQVLNYLMPVPDAQGAGMTAEAKLAMLEGRLALTKEDDYAIQIDTREEPGGISMQIWLVRSSDGLKIRDLGGHTVTPGASLTIAHLHRAFEVTLR